LDYGDGGAVKRYVVSLGTNGFSASSGSQSDMNSLPKTWEISAITDIPDEKTAIKLCDGIDGKYFANSCPSGTSTDTGFSRYIEISKTKECLESPLPSTVDSAFCENAIFVRSVVKFDKDKEVVLEEIMTNWKGGAL